MPSPLDNLTDALGLPKSFLDALYPMSLYQKTPPMMDRTPPPMPQMGGGSVAPMPFNAPNPFGISSPPPMPFSGGFNPMQGMMPPQMGGMGMPQMGGMPPFPGMGGFNPMMMNPMMLMMMMGQGGMSNQMGLPLPPPPMPFPPPPMPQNRK